MALRGLLYRTIAEIDLSSCVKCGLCAKACPTKAISWMPRSYPVVNTKLCTGCSICVQSCPRNSIRMVRHISLLPILVTIALLTLAVLSVYAMHWATQVTPGESVSVGEVKQIESTLDKYANISWSGSGSGKEVERDPLSIPSGG